MSQATFVENIYRKLQHGQNITGRIGAEHKGTSHIECFYTVSISRVRVWKLEPGQNRTGQIGTEHKGISTLNFLHRKDIKSIRFQNMNLRLLFQKCDVEISALQIKSK